jgi:hypothetical protein
LLWTILLLLFSAAGGGRSGGGAASPGCFGTSSCACMLSVLWLGEYLRLRIVVGFGASWWGVDASSFHPWIPLAAFVVCCRRPRQRSSDEKMRWYVLLWSECVRCWAGCGAGKALFCACFWNEFEVSLALLPLTVPGWCCCAPQAAAAAAEQQRRDALVRHVVLVSMAWYIWQRSHCCCLLWQVGCVRILVVCGAGGA